MSSRRRTPRRKKSNKRNDRPRSTRKAAARWTCVVHSRGQGRQHVVACIDDDTGWVLSLLPAERPDDPETLLETYRRALQSDPLQRSAPQVVRFLSEQTASILRDKLPKTTRVLVQADENLSSVLDEALGMLDEQQPDDSSPDDPWGSSIPDAILGRFFETSAKFHAAKPWKIIPSEMSRLGLSAEQLGVERGVVLVFGSDDSPSGWYLFDSAAAADRFLYTVGGADRLPDEADSLPRLTLIFESASTLGTEAMKRVEEASWQIDENALPVLVASEQVGGEAEPGIADYELAAAVSEGLDRLVALHAQRLPSSWNDDAEPWEENFEWRDGQGHSMSLRWTIPAPLEKDVLRGIVIREPSEKHS